jgi:hypothetical protein
MIYLAAPYSSSNPDVVAERIRLFLAADAELTRHGYQTVSPLYKHFICDQPGVGADWQYWQDYSIELMTLCSRLFVLCIPGWQDSDGVAAEIDLANTLGLPITYYTVHINQTILKEVK